MKIYWNIKAKYFGKKSVIYYPLIQKQKFKLEMKEQKTKNKEQIKKQQKKTKNKKRKKQR